MTTPPTVDARLETLEREVADIRRLVCPPPLDPELLRRQAEADAALAEDERIRRIEAVTAKHFGPVRYSPPGKTDSPRIVREVEVARYSDGSLATIVPPVGQRARDTVGS